VGIFKPENSVRQTHSHSSYSFTWLLDKKSATGIINNLIYITDKRGIMYVGDLQNNIMVHRLEHLSCYLPGVLALGASTLDLTPEEKELHQWAAHGLASTCAITYADQASGLGPDQVHMPVGKKWVDELAQWEADGRNGTPPGVADPTPEKVPQNRDYVSGWPDGYLLRPEVRHFSSFNKKMNIELGHLPDR
jgi:mannosyl-oligosaccharide alpha-1,2-mannosidase